MGVPRQEVVAEFQSAARGMGGHNQLRQGYLKLESFWKVKKWEKRMLISMLSSCLVDAFCLWEHLTEVTAADKVAVSRESRAINFACSLIEELRPT